MPATAPGWSAFLFAFEPQDVVLIHEGLKARAARQGQGTLLARDNAQTLPIA